MNRRGLAVVEAACSLMLIAGALTLALQLFQVASARLWLDHLLYQSLICVAQDEPFCVQQATRRAKVSFTKDVRFQLSSTSKGWQGTYRWEGFAGARLNGKMELALGSGKKVFPLWP